MTFFPAEWVKAKLKALRNRYVKAKKPAASGSARKNPTKRTTWLLEKLQFLAPHVATRASVSNLDSVSTCILKFYGCCITCYFLSTMYLCRQRQAAKIIDNDKQLK